MSSNRKPHGDSGINVLSTGAESRQDAVPGRDRGRKGQSWKGCKVVSLIRHLKKSLTDSHLQSPSKPRF